MLTVEMLPARHGDCLLVTYGGPADPHRILIDAGPTGTYSEALKPRLDRRAPLPLELFVVTHYDLDHIGGAIAMLRKPPAPIAATHVWFNGWGQLRKYLAPVQGDQLSKLLARLPFRLNDGSWFPTGAVAISTAGTPRRLSLPGGAKITILSPGGPELQALRVTWRSARTPPAAGPRRLLYKRPPPGRITPGDVPKLAAASTSDDTSVANGSSIAFILEHARKKVLFAGDAHPSVLADSLRRVGGGKRIPFTAVKLPHHGSCANVTREWLDLVSAREYLVSTNGDQYGHPDPEGIARVVMQPGRKVIRFNYATDYTKPWRTAALQSKYRYEAFVGGREGATAPL